MHLIKVVSRKIWFAFSYLRYLLRARSRFRVHSPYIYSLYTDVILDKSSKEVFTLIEKRRASLLKQRSLLEITDFGTGAGKNPYRVRFRQIRSLTRHSSIRPKYGRLLHRLAGSFQAEEVLEIGTAMGISSMYIASAVPESRMITMEGCAMIADKAAGNFRKMDMRNIEVDVGSFDLHLEKTLANFNRLDFVFLDGNHRQEASMRYFRLILPKLHPGSVMVIDDIHRSKGMQRAWEKIRDHEKVSISIDLFRLGIVLFKDDIAKQNFILKY
ncbi:MAG: class I SAM-dependent methyltransferase [Bacteroidales bacterium]|nr:class I SAM-dependent methyltransferase [Bacteroidales bacterium]